MLLAKEAAIFGKLQCGGPWRSSDCFGPIWTVEIDEFIWRRELRVNAMSTRIRHFGAVAAGKSRLMSVVVGMENAPNQRLG